MFNSNHSFSDSSYLIIDSLKTLLDSVGCYNLIMLDQLNGLNLLGLL